MQRRWFLYIGLITLIASTASLALAVLWAGDLLAIVPSTVMMLGSIFFMLGGANEQLWSLKSYQFIGAAQVLIGLAFAAIMLAPILTNTTVYEGSVQLFLAVAAIIGGASLLYSGFDWIRGGKHRDLSAFRSKTDL